MNFHRLPTGAIQTEAARALRKNQTEADLEIGRIPESFLRKNVLNGLVIYYMVFEANDD